MKNFLLLIFLLTLVACEWESSSESTNVGFAKTLTEEQVLDQTMKDFIGDAKTQDEIDRNIILNHIIDKKLDMQSTPSGIYYQMIQEGQGKSPTMKNVVQVNYRGTFLDGKVFDSSLDKNKPFTHPLSRLNKGWKQVLPMMKIGSKGIFIIPSSLCYGETGWGELIPPNAVLKFEIELLGIKSEEK